VKNGDCPRHDEAARAARAGSLGEELRGHTDVCAACRETLLVAGFLAAFAATAPPAAAPDPGPILQRARFLDKLMREQALIERATRPVLITEAIVQAALVGGLMGLGWLGAFGTVLPAARWLAEPLGLWSRVSGLVLSSVAAAALAFLLALRALRAEE
jgi:hypothetical protein